METWGRLCERSTPRSASSWATVFEAGAEPRSAWIVSWPGSIPWRSQLSAISLRASAPDSWRASIQPTTKRLKRSSST